MGIFLLSGKDISDEFLRSGHLARISYILSSSIDVSPSSLMRLNGSNRVEKVLELTMMSRPFAESFGRDNFSMLCMNSDLAKTSRKDLSSNLLSFVIFTMIFYKLMRKTLLKRSLKRGYGWVVT